MILRIVSQFLKSDSNDLKAWKEGFFSPRNMTFAFQKHDNMSVAEQCSVPTVYESWNSV